MWCPWTWGEVQCWWILRHGDIKQTHHLYLNRGDHQYPLGKPKQHTYCRHDYVVSLCSDIAFTVRDLQFCNFFMWWAMLGGRIVVSHHCYMLSFFMILFPFLPPTKLPFKKGLWYKVPQFRPSVSFCLLVSFSPHSFTQETMEMTCTLLWADVFPNVILYTKTILGFQFSLPNMRKANI